MKSIKQILEPFILDDKNHLYTHNANYLIKQLEDNQIEFGKKLLEKAAENVYLQNGKIWNEGSQMYIPSVEINKESITSVLDDYLLNNKI